MSIFDRIRRLPPLGWALIFAVLMVLPGLGSSGFWDPWELSVADQAREIARAGDLFEPTVKGRFAAEPPLDLALTALGMKMFGMREFGARFLNGLCAIGALLAVYWAGVGLFRRRAALLATLALGTMPLFFLQARQLMSDMPLIFGLALSFGGLGRYLWPSDGRRRLPDLLIAGAGFAIGTLSGGALMGVALPALSMIGTVLAAWSLTPRPMAPAQAAAALAAPGVGRDVSDGKSFGSGLLGTGVRGFIPVVLVGILGLSVLVVTLTTANIAGKYSLLLGGTPRGGTPAQMFEYLVRQLGFGLFPWSALVVFALGRALVRMGDGDASNDGTDDGNSGGRAAFGLLYALVFAAFGFALATVFVLMTGDARYPVLAPLALALGAFLDEALEGERAEPVLGLLAATGTMVVARDIFLAPEELVSQHLLAKVKWPPTINVGYGVLVAGLLVGGGIYLGLATRGRALGKVAPRELGAAPAWRRKIEALVVQIGRFGIHVAVVAAILFSGLVAHALVPVLSRHLSFKPVLESFARFAKAGEEIGKYHVEGHGATFYGAGKMSEIASQDALVTFLKQGKRAFALVSADDLAALDAALKTAQTDYVVVDASSSRFLLLSNRQGEGEEDQNPLKKNVWLAPKPPTAITAPAEPVALPPTVPGQPPVATPPPAPPVTTYDWHGQLPPWGAPRVPASAVFGGCIELTGADFPATVRRPGKVPLALHFRVLCRPPGGYKIFAHFDAAGEPRVLGDHAPLEGAFPTSYWLPGEYIKDFTEVDVPLMTTPAGVYTLLVGFWPGGEGRRIAITAGNTDGQDRARIGTIDIR